MPLEKALITNNDTGEKIEVLFNPQEYSLSKDNNFAQVAVPGLRSPLLQFVHGNLQTLDYSQRYVVNQGETLAGIAARVYHNPALWRPIALRNGIDNPRRLVVGQRLLVPRLPYRDPETGEVMR